MIARGLAREVSEQGHDWKSSQAGPHLETSQGCLSPKSELTEALLCQSESWIHSFQQSPPSQLLNSFSSFLAGKALQVLETEAYGPVNKHR